MRNTINRSPRPLGIIALSLFFVFGSLASGLSALMLIVPGTAMDALWRLNPHAQQGLTAMGHWSVLLMATVCAVCFSAAWGLWLRKRWGYWMATMILSINLVADTINFF